jgi:hypothetical protein
MAVIVNPCTIPSALTTSEMSHSYSVELIQENRSNIRTGNVSAYEIDDKISTVNRDIFETIFSVLRESIVGYMPPITSFLITITSTVPDVASYIKASNVLSLKNAALIDFIAGRLFILLARIQNHITTGNDSLCESGIKRLFYMEIENCEFFLKFTYN